MKSLLPRHLLIATGLLLIILATFFTNGSSVLDIHLHDTYYIVAHQQLIYFFAAISLLLWGLYWLLGRILFLSWLNWTHVLLTILPIGVFTTSLIIDNHTRLPNKAWTSFETAQLYIDVLTVFALILLLGQLVFLVHLLLGVVKFIRRH